MGFQIGDGDEWTWEVEDDEGETYQVTFEYHPASIDARKHYQEVMTDDEATWADQENAMVSLALDATDGLRGMDGPDGEPVEWNDDEEIAEQFSRVAETARQARSYILRHLGDSYQERGRSLGEYCREILDADELGEEEQKKPETSSDDA